MTKFQEIVLGTLSVLSVAGLGWGVNSSVSAARQEITLEYHERRISTLEVATASTQKSLIEIQKDTVELLGKQDTRLTLVENVIKQE